MQQRIFIQTNAPYKMDSSPFTWSDFFSFRRMITLQVIEVIYFIVAGLISVGAIAIMFFGKDLAAFINGGFLTGIAILVLGNILWRICCELIIVFFQINKTLADMDKHTKVEHL